jgi:putative lipase involved disintegration of autophagic bodies
MHTHSLLTKTFAGLLRSSPMRSSLSVRAFASVGEKLPSVDLHLGFPPKKYNLAEYTKGKKVILLGLPGALYVSTVNIPLTVM